MTYYVIFDLCWTYDQYKNENILPYGWLQSDRSLFNCWKIIGEFSTEERAIFVCRKLNNRRIAYDSSRVH